MEGEPQPAEPEPDDVEAVVQLAAAVAEDATDSGCTARDA